MTVGLLSASSMPAQQGSTPTRTRPEANTFNAAWQPAGPAAIRSISHGTVSGRMLSLAADPNDTTGNTVYAGSAGGGVWKSVNAAGPLASVTFQPLSDTLSAFSNASLPPSLFIGALAVQPAANPVVLAGTGDPNGNADSYYGEGILRSTDGGVTWTLVNTANDLPNAVETFSGLAASGFAWSTANTALVVAAFADSPQALIVGATGVTSLPGLYYSGDAGATWHMATIYDGATVVQQPQPVRAAAGNAATSVVWNAQRKMFIAALRTHGYYGSTDGMTWKRLDAQPGATMSTANCPVGAGGLGRSSTCPVYRGSLAVQPVTGDTYAWTVDINGVDQGVWQDLCGLSNTGVCTNTTVSFANRVDQGALDVAGGKSGGGMSSLSLLASSTSNNVTALFAGGADLFRCTMAAGSSACAFRNTTNAANGCATPAAVSPNQHAMAAQTLQGSGAGLLLANDGGLWRSTDNVNETGAACNANDAAHFVNLNDAVATGGAAAQVVGFAQDPSDPTVLLAGFGANGTVAASMNHPGWVQLSQTEGGFPHIDQANPLNWYASIGAGVNLKTCALGTSCSAADFATPATIGSTQVSGDTALPHAPSLLDPAQSSNAVLGTCRVWRGPAGRGDLWSSANAISAPFAGNAPCTAASPLVRSVGAGGPNVVSADAQHNGSAVIYAGMAGGLDGGGALGGHLFVTVSADKTTATTAWTDVSKKPVTNATGSGGMFNPSGFDVSSVFVDPHDATGATVLVTIQGFGVPVLYRSTDFGQHWLNVTSNLPGVPANSVVVDPNDANTVYIALDSGVYATTAINTCATADCWALYGSSLPNAPVTQLRAGAALPTGDGRQGLLRAATYGRGIWQIPLLASVPVVAPGITASPTSLAFSAQQVGTQSAAQSVTFTSSGSAAVTVTSITAPTGYLETDTCTGKTLAVGDACSAQVQFAPTATGDAAGVLTLFANVPGGQVTAALTGTGLAPASIVLTPASLSFPATIVRQSSAAQIVTIANTGGTTATLQTPTVSGDFSIVANTCGASLPSQTACSVSVQFTPTDKGTRTGLMTVVDSAGTQTATLTGIGEAPATDALNVTSLTFTQQQAVGSTSAAQQVTMTNAGDVPLLLNSVSVTGDFSISNNCGTSVPARATCSVDVRFLPSVVGSRTGTLTIIDQFRSQAITLSGIGVAPAGVSLTPQSLTFGAIGVGLSAPAQTVTLTNNGGLPLNIAKLTVSGDFALAANTCNASLSVNSACTMTVVFAPTVAGARSGSITLVDDAPTGTQTVALSGTGIDFALAANGPTTQTVTSGTSATYALTMQSTSGLIGNVAFACTGAPAHSLCTVNPGSVSLGANASVTVTVQTGLAMAKLEGLAARGRYEIVLALLPLGVLFVRKRRRHFFAVIVTLCLAFASGCGTPRTIPGSGGTSTPATPTPAGTYTLTVTGTAAGITHAVPLTLIVQ